MSLAKTFGAIAAARQEAPDRTWLLPYLIKGLSESREKQAPGPNGWIGISSVPTLCPRQYVIAYRLGLTLVQELGPQNRWAMDRGTATHIVFQELWLGPLGILYGGWRCGACGHVHGARADGTVVVETSVAMPTSCDRCGVTPRRGERFRYAEPQVIDDELKLRGQLDGLLRLRGGEPFEVVDLKTTAGLSRVRDAPRSTDVEQVQWYCDMTGISRGRLVYMDPGEKQMDRAFVEHQVTLDHRMMYDRKERIRALRQDLADESRPVSPCPYDGKGAYGECGCVEMDVLWARAGN